MSMSVLVFLIVLMVIGGGLYLVTSNKWSELGRILFFVALLWLVYLIQGKGLHL
jgi:hypothetical protein